MFTQRAVNVVKKPYINQHHILLKTGSVNMDLSIDLTEKGLAMIFRPYQIASLELIWNSDDDLTSLQVWQQVNEQMLVSRASIINFLNASVEYGLLDFVEKKAKGGGRIYSQKFTKPESIAYLSNYVTERMETLKEDPILNPRL